MTPEAIADALAVAKMGGDVGRLALVCFDAADRHTGIGRQRLLDAAESLAWAGQLLEILDDQETDGNLRGCR
jgi:hypothetical protein